MINRSNLTHKKEVIAQAKAIIEKIISPAGEQYQKEYSVVESNTYRINDKTLADSAIDGLFGGLLAGAVMGVVIVLGWVLIGEAPATLLERFSPGQSITPAAGVLMHLAVSGVYGVGFSLLASGIPRRIRAQIPGWLAGLIYGGLLLVLALNLILPELHSTLGELLLWIMALGHAVYGIVLGIKAYPKVS
jgi:hypothetical protein